MYDWIVVGSGITGSVLSYELQKSGFKVLLLEKDSHPQNATYYSYGGLTQWWRTDPLTTQLAQEGSEIQRQLSEELDSPTEFREIPLILTVHREEDPQTVLKQYDHFAIQPQYLDTQEACTIEPLLNADALSGAFLFSHAHIHPQKTNFAYLNAFQRQGGMILNEEVITFLQDNSKIIGVKTQENSYFAENTVICAGGSSRLLLESVGVNLPLYFTHSYVIKTEPSEIQMNSLVMAANQQRLSLEKQCLQENFNPSSILDIGAVQFLDKTLCLGQISAINPNIELNSDLNAYSLTIRSQIAKILPSLQNIPGKIHHCLVAFCPNRFALVGNVPNYSGLYVFSGFTSTLIFCPPLARHFVRWVQGETSSVMTQLLL